MTPGGKETEDNHDDVDEMFLCDAEFSFVLLKWIGKGSKAICGEEEISVINQKLAFH